MNGLIILFNSRLRLGLKKHQMTKDRRQIEKQRVKKIEDKRQKQIKRLF